MTDTDQQITPADATIVSTGTGTKGPEERELPESLSNDMSLCLRILRDVLGEYDPQLLATFDTVPSISPERRRIRTPMRMVWQRPSPPSMR